ncbi:endonuclease/exonuclease/phosphatase family protein [Rhizoctonia solani 123E]|uniref:Endonuclease/exonuclease/phosphatase family protein n=1 Tax=Rhizoctonia solani 123E TaxID=1423351 RepID=A0A074RLQ1_9AGAM|nr:endonuclease/exonuclease/phosphatase family protein [Rhizoctonia solani 123E]
MLRRSIAWLAAGALCLAAPPSPNEQSGASSGTFNVMSIRVDGIPAILDPSDPSDFEKNMNTKYIGEKMAANDYGIVNVQEDYSYHRTLYQEARYQFNTETSGDVPFGSGLNTLSKYGWIDFSRVEWYACGNACLTPLGFTFMRVRVDEGVYIDMINLDIDRGYDLDDRVARRWNIKQLSEFIRTQSEGNAVIVFGNTASLYSRFEDNIRLLTTQNGLQDAWVKAIGGSAPAIGMDITCPKGVPPNINCEDEQKILYRGSPIINLTCSGFFYDTLEFLSSEGKLLSNQNPVRAEFQWRSNSNMRLSDPQGGTHGTPFNDFINIPSAAKLASITLRGANRLDGLTLKLTSGKEFTHGGSGGNRYTLKLDPGEYISLVKLCWAKRNGDDRIFYAEAITNKKKAIHAGQWTNNCTTVVAPGGYGVVGTYGRDGVEIDRLGFIYAKQ